MRDEIEDAEVKKDAENDEELKEGTDGELRISLV